MAKRILILGGTGRTGQRAVELALKQGYKVNVLARNPGKIVVNSDRLTIIGGLPTNINDVRKAMKDCDVVISLLSALPDKESFSFRKVDPPHTLENSISNTISMMKEYSIKRILILSSIGVGDSYKYAPWFMKLMFKITNFKIVFADHNAQERLLQNSGLDWTFARPVALNDNDTVRSFVVNYTKTPRPFKMSRMQLARFFIENVDSTSYIHKTPILSGK